MLQMLPPDPPPGVRGYMINVASYRHGVGYGEGWAHVDGWSDGVLRWIDAIERT